MRKRLLWVALIALSPVILYGLLLGVGFSAITVSQTESAIFSEVTSLLGSHYPMQVMLGPGGRINSVQIVGSDIHLAQYYSNMDPTWSVFFATNGSWVRTSFGDGIATDIHVIGAYNGISFTLTKPNDLVWIVVLTINTSAVALGGTGLFLVVGRVRTKMASSRSNMPSKESEKA